MQNMSVSADVQQSQPGGHSTGSHTALELLQSETPDCSPSFSSVGSLVATASFAPSRPFLLISPDAFFNLVLNYGILAPGWGQTTELQSYRLPWVSLTAVPAMRKSCLTCPIVVVSAPPTSKPLK